MDALSSGGGQSRVPQIRDLCLRPRSQLYAYSSIARIKYNKALDIPSPSIISFSSIHPYSSLNSLRLTWDLDIADGTKSKETRTMLTLNNCRTRRGHLCVVAALSITILLFLAVHLRHFIPHLHDDQAHGLFHHQNVQTLQCGKLFYADEILDCMSRRTKLGLDNPIELTKTEETEWLQRIREKVGL